MTRTVFLTFTVPFPTARHSGATSLDNSIMHQLRRIAAKSIMCSLSCSHFSIVLITVLVFIGDSALGQPFLSCSNDVGNYTRNGTFESNLNTVLSSITNGSIRTGGFYNLSAGSGTEKVNLIVLCRGDIRLDVCLNCFNNNAPAITRQCPNQKQAIGIYDECLIRYSNRSIFGKLDNYVIFASRNSENSSTTSSLNPVLNSSFPKFRSDASGGSSVLKFATGQDNVTNFENVYMMMQCSPDLSQWDCNTCLERNVNEIPRCCGWKKGARVVTPSCAVRFETYKFFNMTHASSLPSLRSSNFPPTPSPLTDNGTNWSGYLFIIVATRVFFLLLASFIFFIRKKAWQKLRDGDDDDMRPKESYNFDFAAIQAATNDFSSELGRGGFGFVYKGILSNGQEIAVKRLSRDSGQGDVEFKNEVMLVGRLRHRNLIRLLGFCLHGDERLLVYEFVSNTSLDNFLFNRNKRILLNWEPRYKIIGGIARGLLYLHEDSRLRIIHRDLKASNILLDAEMNPKISDFGTAKLAIMDQTDWNTTRPVGTPGYMAPEYALHGEFSVKTDVFSFGVLILEIVSGRKNQESLLNFVWKNWREGSLLNVVDPTFSDGHGASLVQCIHIGLLCVQENVEDRPSMATIVLMLSNNSITLPVPSQPAFFTENSFKNTNVSTGNVSVRTSESWLNASFHYDVFKSAENR